MSIRHNFSRQPVAGFMLIQAIAISFIVMLVLYGMLSLSSMLFRGQRKWASKSEQTMVLENLFLYIDCPGTFTAAGIDPLNPGANCNSTSSSGGQLTPYLRLKRRTVSGTYYFSDPLQADGSAIIGGFRVRASCSRTEKTLVIRGELVSQPSNFSLLLAGSENYGGVPQCRGSF